MNCDPYLAELIDRVCLSARPRAIADPHQDFDHYRETLLADFLRTVGARHRDASFENYDCDRPEQEAVVARLAGYVNNAPKEIRAGSGIFAIGAAGSGKTHLLVAAAREIIGRYGISVVRTTGYHVFAKLRDAIATNGREAEVLRPMLTAGVLIIDDPIPPTTSELSEYQRNQLFALVDGRYEHRRPTWLSANFADGPEAFEKLGRATADRLRDGAVVPKFDWPSYRKSQG
jgi:DNA replication protein DnaC